MTTRRSFLKTLAAMPPALALRNTRAAPHPARLALVIGNGDYPAAPLPNPANDARAVGKLLGEADFNVDLRLDATREGMIAAIERLGAAARHAEGGLVLFYYAGHGAQLDWRNYLLPTGTMIEKPAHMKERCIDLGLLLDQFGAAAGRTFIVILDACRNNPFGSAYRPEQKGLSQFDAPVGSLLAYSTAPGNAASDGEGQHGLYTEHLIRELSQRNARIEDALKRVRLGVRLASRGEQVPWESTSLESDVFLFGDGQKKLSETELEKLIETDIAAWERIRSSKNIDDWIGYLRQFPNGRFAEIAQMRLARLLAEVEKRRPEPAKTVPASAQAEPPSDAPRINLGAGLPVPKLMAPSENPYSAGRYPLGRTFTVGDEATIRQSDILTGVVERTYTSRVTRIDLEANRVELNDGKFVSDLMGNSIKAGTIEFDTPLQFVPAEFQIGRKWTAAFRRTQDGKTSNAYYDLQIVKRETVSVPAGSFDTFLIEGRGWNLTFGSALEVRFWLLPGINFPIKVEQVVRNKFGRFIQTERRELVSLRQHVMNGASGSAM